MGIVPKRRLKKKLLVALGGVALALIVGELGLRVAGVTYPVFFTYDSERGMALRPGKSGWYHKEGNAFVEVNRHGYRDVEHALEKPEGVTRIAIVGDSFTEAREVDLQATYWKQLESRLSPENGAGPVIEVLSFGVGSYGTSQELLTLRRDVLRFSPDVVLLAFFTGNDIMDNTRALSEDDYQPFFSLKEGQLVLDDSFRRPSLRNWTRRCFLSCIHYSRLLEVLNQFKRSRDRAQQTNRFARRMRTIYPQGREGAKDGAAALAGERVRAPSPAERGLSNSVFVEPTNDTWKGAWEVTEALIEQMAVETRAAGAEFVLMAVPASIQVTPDPKFRERQALALGVEDLSYCDRRLLRLGERAGFPVIELTSRMAALAESTETHLHGFENTRLGTGHWNEKGHALVAELIADDLRRFELIR